MPYIRRPTAAKFACIQTEKARARKTWVFLEEPSRHDPRTVTVE